MKASDIPDELFLGVVAELQNERGMWANRFDLAERLDFPDKVVLAKARRLIRRGRLTGCWCGCRGDFEVVA